MHIAITRDVSPSIGRCELTYLPRVAIDYRRAAAQHERYRQSLASLGCRTLSLPAEPALPDAVFVEDAALVLDEIAIITRPGVDSRRPEAASIERALQEHRPLAHILAPGTLEGGDILRVGKAIYVGLSGRSNAAGIEQLRAIATPHGYTVQGVPMSGCLHLKSAVTQVAPGTLLLNSAWLDSATFAGYTLLEVDPAEPFAANALLAGTGLIYPASFPRTARLLAGRGIAITTVDVSELQKAEGAVTCCSLVFAGSQ
jgi:dimethylargininase